MLKISLEFFAEHELNNAADFYDEQRLGLGSEFSAQVRNAFLQIVKSPSIWQLVKGNIHRYRVDQFPYCIYYRFDDEFIYILAISHNKRKPL